MSRIYLAVLITALSVSAHASVTLEGDYQLAGPLTHQGATTPGKSHLYINITGDAAKTLYDSLAVKSLLDQCTGMKFKGIGNVACYEVDAEKKYFCGFSINLKQGNVEAGLGGCF